MKQVFTLLFIFAIFPIFGQVATGGCSSVTVNSIPPFPTLYIAGGNVGKKFCNDPIEPHCQFIVNGSGLLFPMKAKLTLEKFDGSNWIAVQGPVNGLAGYVFTVATPGKYRVKILTPTTQENFCCVDELGNVTKAKTKIFNINGQFIGYAGTFNNAPFGGTGSYYTNEVFVGPTQQSDIMWNFIDGNEANETDDVFDFGEQVRINTTGTQNHTHWWLAIFENQAPTRYKSKGWTAGQIPNVIDLSLFWDTPDPTWDFLSLHSYTVQLAITNQCNTVWTNLDKTFFVCPAGSGCRLTDMMPELKIAPNPSSDVFKVNGLPLYENSKVVTKVYDMSGKLLKTQDMLMSDEVSISNLQHGFYLVKVLDDKTLLLATKLVKFN